MHIPTNFIRRCTEIVICVQSEIEKDFKVNPKRFFSYVNDKRKTNVLPKTMQYKEVCSDDNSQSFYRFLWSCHYENPSDVHFEDFENRR